MAAIEFPYLYLHVFSDLADQVRMWIADGGEGVGADIGRRRYGGGNTRAVVGPGLLTNLDYDCIDVDRSTVQWLREQTGALLLARDPRGRVHVGFYADVEFVELPGTGAYVDLSIPFQVVTEVEVTRA